MDIVWRKGQVPRKMTFADNGDFDRSANKENVWVRCNLSHFEVDACITGKIAEKFPEVVEDDYVEICLYYAGYDNAVFCCSYTPDGLQCVHIDRQFLIDYGGIVIAPKNEEGMRAFVDMLMQDLAENELFEQAREKQFLISATGYLTRAE